MEPKCTRRARAQVWISSAFGFRVAPLEASVVHTKLRLPIDENHAHTFEISEGTVLQVVLPLLISCKIT